MTTPTQDRLLDIQSAIAALQEQIEGRRASLPYADSSRQRMRDLEDIHHLKQQIASAKKELESIAAAQGEEGSP